LGDDEMKFLTVAFIVLAMLVVACVPGPYPSANTTNESVDVVPSAPEMPQVPDDMPNETISVYYTVEGTEGDLIRLRPEAIDPDGDKVTFSFTAPFDVNGNWQTQIGDEGTHYVAVGASDGKSNTVETVEVIVLRANRAPVIDCSEVVVNEGELVDLHQNCKVTDEDDEKVIVTYGGWMDSWRYETTYEDAGTHYVTITASDRRVTQTKDGGMEEKTLHTVVQNVTVTVKNVNRPPVFVANFPDSVSGVENDILIIPRELITDPDHDPVTVTYSAPFGPDGTWKTKLGDAGSYDIDVVASDGENTIKKTVHVTVGLLNTQPVLKTIPDITVKEGETIVLPISATDREGDPLTTTISGWMTSATYKTTYDDAGEYSVKVIVSDGVYTATQVVHITVVDVNRPPVFVTPA
jgi:hypothetical protein